MNQSPTWNIPRPITPPAQEGTSVQSGSPAQAGPVWKLAAFVFVIFCLTESYNWQFSTSMSMHLDNSEDGILERIQYNVQKQQTGSMARRLCVPLLGCYGVWCLLRNQERRLRIRGVLGWSLIALFGWIILSVLWSIDPKVTVIRVSVLGLQFLGALGLAKRLARDDMIRLTAIVTGVMVFGGLICEILAGGFRPWVDEYRFSGFTWPAFTCWNLSLFIGAVLSIRETGRNYVRPTLGGVAAILALLTKTRTGTAAFMLAAAVRLSATWTASRKVMVAGGACFIASCALLAASFAGKDPAQLVFRSVNLGREESAAGFSGRAGVWAMLVPYIFERPIQGYGYESFWTPERLQEIGQRNWGAPDAHNGYINLTLGVGVVGSALYATALVSAMLLSRRDFHHSGQIEDLWIGGVALVNFVNTFCVASQLNPYLTSFISMMALARIAFVQDPAITAQDLPLKTKELSFQRNWQRTEHASRPA